MHLYAYINLDTYFLCLNCGRSLDFFMVPDCVRSRGFKHAPNCDRHHSLACFLDYARSLIPWLTESFDILVFCWPTQAKRRKGDLLFPKIFRSLVPQVIKSSKWHHSPLSLQILKSSSWLIRKKPQGGRDLHTSREYRFKYYPVVSLGIVAMQWRTSSNDQSWRRGHGKYRSMRAHVIPSPVKQFFKTLSLRRLAYEFAQHKEVPGDQLKPSKERIKNVNISNQQRRCKSLLQN